ncbi:hypothetical protein OQA88_7747 [Cercophora sp. LCS_1]
MHLRPAVESDARQMGLIGSRAFADTISTLLFPPHLRVPGADWFEEETVWRTARTLRRMRDGKDTLVVVDDVDGVETVVGFAQWDRPAVVVESDAGEGKAEANGEATQEAKSDAAENWVPGMLDAEALVRLEAMIGEESERILGPRGYKDMWYLMVLAVDSGHQRRGVGAQLLRWGLEQAAKEGQKAFLYATPEGKPLYEKHGFEVISEVDIGIQHHAMLWTAPDARSN